MATLEAQRAAPDTAPLIPLSGGLSGDNAPRDTAPIAAPPPPRRRAWLSMLLSLVGGVVLGMVLLSLGLAVFGGTPAIAAASGDPAAPWDTSVTLTDAYLTAQARTGPSSQVQNPQLRVQADGKIALDGQVSLIGRQVPLHATLQPTIAGGKLSMAMIGAQLGGLTLPDFIVRQIEGAAAGAATQPPVTGVQTTLVRFEATEGRLVLYSKVGK